MLPQQQQYVLGRRVRINPNAAADVAAQVLRLGAEVEQQRQSGACLHCTVQKSARDVADGGEFCLYAGAPLEEQVLRVGRKGGAHLSQKCFGVQHGPAALQVSGNGKPGAGAGIAGLQRVTAGVNEAVSIGTL